MWLIRIFGALAMLVLVLVAILLLLPGDRIAALAVDRIKAGTGRDLSVSGDVRLTLWPVLGVETGPVVLANADWAGPEPMLRAEALAIGVSAPELLRGEVRITRIAATAPDVRPGYIAKAWLAETVYSETACASTCGRPWPPYSGGIGRLIQPPSA